MDIMKICFIAPLQDYSGYASFSRLFLKTMQAGGLDVVARALKYDQLDSESQYKEEPWLTEALNKPLEGIEMVIQCTTPNIEAQPKPGLINGLYFFWETDRLPPSWLAQIEKFDFVMVPCRFNAEMLVKCGCTKPILVLPPPSDLDIYKQEREPYKVANSEGRTIFYNISQLSSKKGIDALIRAYYGAFADKPDEVLLVLKTYIGMSNRHNERATIEQFINKIRQGCRIPIQKYPPILPITSTMSEEDIHKLHKGCHAYVNSSRGEGHCIPAFDAIGHGNILISSKTSGMADWVDENNSMVYNALRTNVYDMAHGDPSLYTGVEQWFEPSTSEMGHLMRMYHLLRKGNADNILDFQSMDIWNKIGILKENGQKLIERRDYKTVADRLATQLKAAFTSWKEKGKIEFDLSDASVMKIGG